MWTDTTRAQHARTDLALPSDLTDAEWAALEPFLPPPSVVGSPELALERILKRSCTSCAAVCRGDATALLSASLDRAELVLPVAR